MKSEVQLREWLAERREAIVGRWKALALQVYPERASRFLGQERDRFRNPVGHATGENLESLFDGLLVDVPGRDSATALDGIVRIRAVQDLSPSAGVGFVFLLKQAIREELDGSDAGPIDGTGLTELDRRIDRLALEAFDQFVRCREKIYDLRLREIRGDRSTPFACPGAGATDGPTGSCSGGECS